MTLGPRGLFGSVGLPGTGISYRKKLNAPNGRVTTRRSNPPALDPSKLSPEALELMQAVVDGKDGVTKNLNSAQEVWGYWEKIKGLPGAHMINPETGRKMSEAQVRAFARKLEREANIKKLTQEIAEEEARLRDAVRYWHPLPAISDWQSYVDQYEDLLEAPFPEEAPSPPSAPTEENAWADLLKSNRAQVTPTWFARLLPAWAARRAEKSARAAWQEHWQTTQAAHNEAMESHRKLAECHAKRQIAWRSRCAEDADELYRLMAGEDKEMLLETACEAVGDLAIPFQADARVTIDDDVSLSLDIDLPEIEDVVPRTMREVSASGSIRSSSRSGDQLHEPYAELVFGHSLNLAAKLFTELPRLQTTRLAAYTRRNGNDDYVLELNLTRDAVTSVALKSPSTLPDLLSALGQATAIFNIGSDYKLGAIETPLWTKSAAK